MASLLIADYSASGVIPARFAFALKSAHTLQIMSHRRNRLHMHCMC